MIKIAVTGHRPPRLEGKIDKIQFWLEEQLTNLKACYKDVALITGMAAGVDQMAAVAAIKLGIPVYCYFPYRYKLSDINQYIVDNAEKVIYCAETYENRGTYIARDRKMVEDCDILLVVYDGKPTGGTYYTYEYGKTMEKNIFLYPWNHR